MPGADSDWSRPAVMSSRAGRDQSPFWTSEPDDPDAWKDLGNCIGVNPDLFFPERGESSKEAKAVCAGCVVRDECLEHAVTAPELHGIWGGKSEKQRRRLRGWAS